MLPLPCDKKDCENYAELYTSRNCFDNKKTKQMLHAFSKEIV